MTRRTAHRRLIMHTVGGQRTMRKRTSSDSGSEGGDAGVLKARSDARNYEEDEKLRRQDLTLVTLVRSLRLRAERLENCHVHPRITPSDRAPSDRRERPHYTTKFTQSQTLQACAYFTEWRPLALNPWHDLLRREREYEPAEG